MDCKFLGYLEVVRLVRKHHPKMTVWPEGTRIWIAASPFRAVTLSKLPNREEVETACTILALGGGSTHGTRL